MTKVNKSELFNGKKVYLYLNNPILNGRGEYSLNITDDLFLAIDKGCGGKIYEAKLKELEIEVYEEQEIKTVARRRIKE